MNEEQRQAIRAWLTGAMASGDPPEVVDQKVREVFANRGISSLQGLKDFVSADARGRGEAFAVQAAAAAPTQAERDLTTLPGGPVGDVASSMFHDVTANLADDVLATLGFEDAATEMRRRQAIRMEADPVASTLAGIAGTMLVPGMVATKAATLPGKFALGAATAAPLALAASYGASDPEQSAGDRLIAASVPAVVETLASGAVPVVGGSLAKLGRRIIKGPPSVRSGVAGQRAAGQRGRRSTRPGQRDFPTYSQVRQEYVDHAESVADEVFGPIDPTPLPAEAHSVLDEIYNTPGLAQQAFPGAQNRALRTGDATIENIGDLRRIRNYINDAARVPDPNVDLTRVADRLEAFFDDVPGFREGNQTYAIAKDTQEAFEMGYARSRRSGRSSLMEQGGYQTAEQIRTAMEGMNRGPIRDGFQDGLRTRMLEDLFQSASNGSTVPAEISEVVQMASSSRNNSRLRAFFPDTRAGQSQFNSFVRTLERDLTKTDIGHTFRREAQYKGARGVIGLLNPFSR